MQTQLEVFEFKASIQQANFLNPDESQTLLCFISVQLRQEETRRQHGRSTRIYLVCKVPEVVISGSNCGLKLATLCFVTNPQWKILLPRAQLTSGIAQERVSPCLATGTHVDSNLISPRSLKHLCQRMVPPANRVSGVNILNCRDC